MVLAAPPAAKKRVTKGSVLLRTGPGKSHAARALLTEGRSLRVVKSNGQWVRVRLATGTEGWVRRDLLAKPAAPKKSKKAVAAAAKSKKSSSSRVAKVVKPTAAKKTAKVAAAKAAAPGKPVKTVAAVNRASGRSFSRSRVALTRPAPAPSRTTAARSAAEMVTERTGTITIPVTAPESAAAVTAPSTEWTRLARVDASAEEKTTKAAAATPTINRSLKRGDAIVRRALSYRGSPYRRGASGRGAFDCSGFTSYLYRTAGSPIPRTAASQYHVGQKVGKSDLRPGDLVFFKNTYKRGISHVGVYIGNGSFVHASGSGRGVRVDSLNKAYYINHWAGARRPR